MLASYLWDFGDGTTSTDAFATHTYAQTGHYYVCLTATDINGCVSTYCEHLYIYNPNNICAPTLSVNIAPTGGLDYNFSATTSLASPSYFWDFGDGNVSSSSSNTTSHTYQSEGVYYVCLYAYQSTTGCYASYCDSVPVVFTPIPCQTAIQFAPDALDGNTYNFASTQTGVAPFTYSWDFGDGNTSTSATPSNTYVTSGAGMSYFSVSLTVTDADGCVATDSTTVSVFSYGDVISGVVAKEATLQFFGDAIVYLIQYDSTSGTLTAVDTTFTTQGFYQFSNVAAGSYLVKAALLTTDTDYTDYLPTYYGQSLAWTNATFVSPAPVDSGFVYNIVLIKGTNLGGAGFIGGMVVNGAGRPIIGNQTLIENIGELDAMPNVSVLLLDYNDNAVTHTVTAADGSYSFDKLDMGHYRVHVEEVGKMTFPANILIDPAGMHHTEVHFTIHSNMVTLTMVNRVMANIEQLNIFPNPVQDNLNVSLELKESMDLTINVTNLLGQQLISENRSLQGGAQNFELDLQNLPSGLYLLSLTSGTDIVTHKIYKQ
jgi:PKD repeat protein